MVKGIFICLNPIDVSTYVLHDRHGRYNFPVCRDVDY